MNNIILPQVARDIVPILQTALGESPTEALRIARMWYLNRSQSRKHWKVIAETSSNQITAQTQEFEILDLLALVSFLSTRTEGIVLATIHMGDYIQALLTILSKLSNRKVFLVRRKASDDVSSEVFAKLHDVNVDYEVIYSTESTAALKALRNLKRGAILVMFYDLPNRFGNTSNFSLFGQTVRWVSGPVLYASMANALLVPFITFRNQAERTKCELHPVISFEKTSLEHTTQISQSLVSLAGRYIRSYPSQWLHWHLMPEMLAESQK